MMCMSLETGPRSSRAKFWRYSSCGFDLSRIEHKGKLASAGAHIACELWYFLRRVRRITMRGSSDGDRVALRVDSSGGERLAA